MTARELSERERVVCDVLKRGPVRSFEEETAKEVITRLYLAGWLREDDGQAVAEVG